MTHNILPTEWTTINSIKDIYDLLEDKGEGSDYQYSLWAAPAKFFFRQVDGVGEYKYNARYDLFEYFLQPTSLRPPHKYTGDEIFTLDEVKEIINWLLIPWLPPYPEPFDGPFEFVFR